MTTESVQLTIEDEVATVLLNQPEKSNPLNPSTATELRAAFETIAAEDVRCVVIEGAGNAFSAGGDVSVMENDLDPDQPVDDRLDTITNVSGSVRTVAECAVPVVAKIDGPAVGAGASLAIACDIQVASRSSRVGFVFRNVGLTVDATTSYFLVRQVGLSVAKDLVFRGTILGAEEARDRGLVTHVYPEDEFEERVDELIDELASGPTVALTQSKRLLNEAGEKSLREAEGDEIVAQNLVVETDDYQEGVRAFLAGEEPEFTGS